MKIICVNAKGNPFLEERRIYEITEEKWLEGKETNKINLELDRGRGHFDIDRFELLETYLEDEYSYFYDNDEYEYEDDEDINTEAYNDIYRYVDVEELEMQQTRSEILKIAREWEDNDAKLNTVEHPAHYNQGKFEVWDVIEDWHLDFFLGNVIKYIARAGHKDNELEDLKKAQNYLNEYIKRLDK